MDESQSDHELARSIAAMLRHMAPPSVEVGARAIRAEDERSLFDDERSAIAHAVATRRREFATGRALLRELIGRSVSIPIGEERRPVLPCGVVASLAHDDRVAIAGTASTEHHVAIGIDIEPRRDLDPDVAREILRPDDSTRDPILAFVLKESAYKAWSNLGGRMLNHQEVRLDTIGSVFTARVEPEGTVLSGRFASASRSCLALVVVER